MECKIRNLYPGGNTPDGFYSYYSYILQQRKAEKIFCIKGGPGVGKSTMMKNIGEYFIGKGESVDFLWCSSDPDSLDGVLLKKRNVAIVDGTAPHIVDPKNPGAVDEIVDLGKFWNESLIKTNKNQIIRCSEATSEIFGYAYGFLKCAREQYDFMAKVLERFITYEKIREYRKQLQLRLDGISIIRRAENKARKEDALGKENRLGERKKAFASAITPAGIKNNISSIIDGIQKIIVIDVPVGFRTEQLLLPVSERLTDVGFDIEEYYCPMFPDDKLEHIVCVDANIAVVCSNEYHNIDIKPIHGKVIKMKVEEDIADYDTGMLSNILRYLNENSHEAIQKAVELLKEAKKKHDILEDYYAPNMDFEAIEKVQREIISKIEKI